MLKWLVNRLDFELKLLSQYVEITLNKRDCQDWYF